MTLTPETVDTHTRTLSARIGTRYRRGVANKRQTPQHTIAVDGDLWGDCLKIARLRHETLTSVLKAHLVRYRARHRHLLAGTDDE